MREVEVGKVTEIEKNQILSLYERIIAIQEVAKTVDDKNLSQEVKERLLAKIKEELPKSRNKFSQWWSKKSKKYNWEKSDKDSWRIDFTTNKIYLQTNN